MSFLTSVLGRYLLVRMAYGVAVVVGVVLATIMLIDVVEQLRGIGARTDLSLPQAVGLTLLRTPLLLEQTSPFIVLAGAMVALTQLNRRSELVAIRASGVSAWRFLAPAMVVAGGLGLISTTVLNPIAANLVERYEREVARLEGRPAVGGDTIWLRQADAAGQVVIKAEKVEPDRARLLQAVFFFFEFGEGGSLSFVRRVAAEEALLRDQFWQLSGVVEGAPGEAPVWSPHLSLPSSLPADVLMQRFASPSTLSFWRLPEVIETARQSGLQASRYEMRWHWLLAAPALYAAMAALGAAFSLRLQRLGGGPLYLGAGIAAGFVMYLVSHVANSFAIAESAPPILAAWAPPIAGVFAAMAVLGFLEDG